MNLVDQITAKQLRDSLKAHRLLITQAQDSARLSREALIGLGMDICGERLDRLQKDGQLEAMSPQDLAEVIRGQLTLIAPSEDSDWGKSAQRLADFVDEVDAARKDADQQRLRGDEAEQKLAVLERQVIALEGTLQEYRQKLSTAEENNRFGKRSDTNSDEAVDKTSTRTPDMEIWFREWVGSGTFERDRTVIQVMGETGYSRLTEIRDIVKERLKSSDRTAYRAVRACEEIALVARRRGTPVDGRPTDMLILTDKGRWVFHELTGQNPRESERKQLLKAHKSDRHLALILKAADLLAGLGYEIEREPAKIKTGDKHFFFPDLIISKDGETLYVEVEHGDQDKTTWDQKWANAFIAGGGTICVVADKKSTLTRIQSSITHWAYLGGKLVTLYGTTIEMLKHASPGELPWQVREKGKSSSPSG